MIKAAGVAGAVAWAAPVIIDSMSSPAAAATAPSGCFRMYNNLDGTWQGWSTSNDSSTSCVVTATECTATTSVAAAAAVGTPTPAPADNSGTTVSVSVNGGYSCKIVAAGAVVNAGGGMACRQRDTDGTSGGTTFGGLVAGTTVTIDPNGGGGDSWDNSGSNRSVVVIVLQCPA